MVKWRGREGPARPMLTSRGEREGDVCVIGTRVETFVRAGNLLRNPPLKREGSLRLLRVVQSNAERFL